MGTVPGKEVSPGLTPANAWSKAVHIVPGAAGNFPTSCYKLASLSLPRV